MTLTELRFIVAVAQERNFHRAAKKSFISQPALSLISVLCYLYLFLLYDNNNISMKMYLSTALCLRI